jgi:hypothetical protein
VKQAVLLLAALAFSANVGAQASSLGEYVYTAPSGWTVTPYPDGIVISSPPSNTGEKCLLQLWPLRPGSNDLPREAASAFAEVFKAFEPRNSEYATPALMARGVSAHGWDYFIVKRAIGIPGQATVSGFVFVARLGRWIAPVSGISKDPLVSSCFGLMVKDAWPKFLYSMQFRSWQPAAGAAPLVAKVPGVWMALSATAGDRYVFAPNGRYASASAAQRYVRLSSSELLRVTDAYFGDGAYALKGHQIVFTPDGRSGTESGLLRVEQESRDGGRTWIDKLYLLRKSNVDGAEYEVAYTRQN